MSLNVWATGGAPLASKIDRLTLEAAETLALTPRIELDDRACDCDGRPNCICEIARADWQRIEAQR